MKDLPDIVGVSVPTVKNACRKFDIPVPAQGHWAKIKAGRKVRIVPLSDRAPGMSDELILGGSGYYYQFGDAEEYDRPLPPPPTFPVSMEDVRSSVVEKIGRVTVPRGRHGWHTAIQRLFAADEKRREKQAASRFPMSWDAPIFDNPFEQRRLRIMNALFLALAKHGGKPDIRNKEAVEIILSVHQQHISLKFMATADLKRNRPYRHPDDRQPAREPLSLVIPSHRHENKIRASWADTPDSKLEARLAEIAVELVVLAETLHREDAERHHRYLIERREDRERKKAAAEAARLEAIRVRQEAFETAKRGMLLDHARDLQHARTLRKLVEDVLARKDVEVGEDTKAWARFVEDEAAKLDPVTDNRFLDVMKLNLEHFGEIKS